MKNVGAGCTAERHQGPPKANKSALKHDTAEAIVVRRALADLRRYAKQV